jgi:hypothetical protein
MYTPGLIAVVIAIGSSGHEFEIVHAARTRDTQISTPALAADEICKAAAKCDPNENKGGYNSGAYIGWKLLPRHSKGDMPTYSRRVNMLRSGKLLLGQSSEYQSAS